MTGPGQRAQGPEWIDEAVREDRQKYAGPRIHSFRDLIAWQKSMDLVVAVYQLSADWSNHDRFGLGSQMQRAAVSIAANIAEGFERRSTKDYLRYIAIACGSLAETETHLRLSARLGLADPPKVDAIVESAREIGRILRGIERSLGRNLGPGP